jgi:hypothetical protein
MYRRGHNIAGEYRAKYPRQSAHSVTNTHDNTGMLGCYIQIVNSERIRNMISLKLND